ncbi:hypothetical protein RCH09_003227 [Actimicrobium sp. GrIS 1.19]|uniref:DUF3025 domain-containing protein n=1 Tax=Actimicrobium sp. GrIS 1.19 TaxID=3071708 RepID=UPI002E0B1403|nr:hypothetical protein [Actimicrobium sp. GrIS 1.19]
MTCGADFRAQIDWTQPWLAPLRPAGENLCDAGCDWRSVMNARALQAGLKNHLGMPITFVGQDALPEQIGYEAFISATGQVPTRANLHDFFNALVWLRFPRIKARLNALQAIDIGSGLPDAAHRSPLRDALTIFDENAAIVVARDTELFALLRAHDWTAVMVDRRDGFATCWQVGLFGHALMEKLVAPYKAITAHAWLVAVDDAYFGMDDDAQAAHLDGAIARQLDARLRTRDFTPLPVLGIPGWQAGQDAGFYADQAVFRQKRASL